MLLAYSDLVSMHMLIVSQVLTWKKQGSNINEKIERENNWFGR